MRLERLQIHNFTSIADVDLNFLDLDPGIIALVGSYGAGKTTILEAPFGAFYRTLPSRDGDLKDYATSKDSFLDARIAVDGMGVFRARVNVDNVRGNSDAVLEQILPDGSVATLNDGKVSTFDQAVRARFPSKDLLLASAIATQNKRGGFIGKKPKEKHELFSELLGLTALTRMGETAKTIGGYISQRIDTLTASLDECARQLAAIGDTHETLAARADALAQRKTDLETTAASTAATVQDLERRLLELAGAVAAYEQATAHQRTAQAALATAQAEYKTRVNQRPIIEATHEEDLYRLSRRLDDACSRINAARLKALADTDAIIAKNQGLLEHAAEIRDAAAAIATIDPQLLPLRTQIEQWRSEQATAIEAARGAELPLRSAELAADDLQRATDQAALIDRVPFGDKCAEAGCQFVQQAATAKARIPEYQAVVDTTPDLQARVRELEAVIDAYTPKINAARSALAVLETRRAGLEKQASKATFLAAADARIEELTKLRAKTVMEADERLAAAREEHAAEVSLRTARYNADALENTKERGAFGELVNDYRDNLAVADADVTETSDAHLRALRVQVDLADAKATAAGARSALTQVLAEMDGLLALELRITEAEVRERAIQLRINRLYDEAREWDTLREALSRDGLPVLEIDAAGPLISQLTNDLLTAAFGPIFSVDLVTQQAKSAGGMKESFDLIVLDQRIGKPRSIGDLSGGEQVIVSEALMNALAIYTNQRSAMPVRTAWRDETAGGLDAAARMQYFAMLRKVHEIGAYHHILFVTHNPELAEMADAQIVVNKETGTAQIARPPYAA